MKNNRYLFKCKHNGDHLILTAKRSVDTDRYPNEFWIRCNQLSDWLWSTEPTFVARDGYDFIEMDKTQSTVRIGLSHIYPNGRRITGVKDEFTILLCDFSLFVLYSCDGETFRCLDQPDFRPPKIVVKDPDRVREIANHPIYRRKFAHFIGHAFQWYGATEIELYSDWVPYSFFFREKCGKLDGMCGGVILHGQDNPPKAYYSVHT